jgi:hypothetical protein
MKISYAITVCNELEEIQRLLDFLLSKKREHDEIIVLMDTTKATDELGSTLRHYERHNLDHMTVRADKFEGHFADWKNKLTSYCSGDYIFQIDADEVPSEFLVRNLFSILESNEENEVYLVPRINTVDGLTQEHVRRWGWQVDFNGYVNFPDYQWRIYKNVDSISWMNKVHEKLSGFTTYATLPADAEYSLIHHKTIEKQEKQNNYYNTL